MSKKKHLNTRLARIQKSQKAKKKLTDGLYQRDESGADISEPIDLHGYNQSKILQKKVELQKRLIQLIGEKVMLTISNKFRGGQARYITMRAVSEDASSKMKYELEKSLVHITSLPKERQTTQITIEAGNIIEELQNGFMDAGLLIEEPVNFMRGIPNTIIIDGDSPRIMNKLTEPDYLDMVEMFKSEVQKVKKPKIAYLERFAERLEKEVESIK